MKSTRTAASELVTIMYDEGVSHLFVSPGMLTASMRAALSDAQLAGMPHPRPVLCVHEHVAVSAAHGHHLAGGGLQAVMVHVDGAALSLGGAAESAQRDRIPIALFVGHSGGAGEGLEHAGEHDNGVPRPGEPFGAGGRPAGKWSAVVRREGEMSTFVRRAFQIARAAPAGVTHVTLSRESLQEPAGEPSRRLPPPRPPAADLAAMEELAELLATAEAPLIIAGRVGRNVASVHSLAELAETLGAPVMDMRNHVNLPPQHPLNMAMEGGELLEKADAILLLDVDMFCRPQAPAPAPAKAWLLQIDADCLKPDVPGWAYPIEVGITADTSLALPQLQSLLTDRLSGRREAVQERRARVEETLAAARQAWRARAASGDRQNAADAVLAELNNALPENALILEEVTASARAVLRQIERAPGQFFRHTASSPGWSLGAALGARLARPTQPVVALCDAAAFNFGLPTAAFWSAHRAGAPFLAVVLDRQDGTAPPAGRPAEQRPGLNGASVEPAAGGGVESDVIALARACGAEGEVVERSSDVAAAVERLLAITRDGVCAVLYARI